MTTWECVNQYGAIVYDGLYENEAQLIATQHHLVARENSYKRRVIEQLRADDWYADEVVRLQQNAPA